LQRWRGPSEPGEFPTLGYQVGDFIEAHCAIPDGDYMGQPYLLIDEMWRFLLWHYRLDPETGRFVYRRSQLKRPQKWGKGPFSAGIICAEAEGPVLFDGWDANGEPVGRPWATPWIQVTAASEGQTDNVWRALGPMIEEGDLGWVITDTGETRINLRGGGRIEPVTSSAKSRLGQRITFAVQDETHSWLKENGGWKLADTQRRNLAGMGGRSIETTNAWDPAEESVAQVTAQYTGTDIYRDHGAEPKGSIRNKRELRRCLKQAYGGSWWVDLERIEAEVDELAQRDPAQAERYYLNRVVAGAGQAFDMDRWRKLALGLAIPTGVDQLVTVGFDGARFVDATALVATHVELGHQWPLGVWERSPGAGDDWEVSEAEVTEALEEAFDTFNVWRVYCNPAHWGSTVDAWAGRWGEKRVIRWWTNRNKQMCWALRGYVDAQAAREMTHSGDETFTRHVTNARKKIHPGIRDDKGRPMWTLQKERESSTNCIDAAQAGCLSWEARGDAVASGVLSEQAPEPMLAWT
jgi:hypothetical protein